MRAEGLLVRLGMPTVTRFASQYNDKGWARSGSRHRSAASGTGSLTIPDTSSRADPPPGLVAVSPGTTSEEAVWRRFFGVKQLNAKKYAADLANVHQDVLAHLDAGEWVQIEVRLEIAAVAPDDLSDNRVRIVLGTRSAAGGGELAALPRAVTVASRDLNGVEERKGSCGSRGRSSILHAGNLRFEPPIRLVAPAQPHWCGAPCHRCRVARSAVRCIARSMRSLPSSSHLAGPVCQTCGPL